MCIIEWLFEYFQAFPGTSLSILVVLLGGALEAAVYNVIPTPRLQLWARMETLSQCFHPREFVTGMNKAKPFSNSLACLSAAVAGLAFSQMDQMQRYLSEERAKCDQRKAEVTDGKRSCTEFNSLLPVVPHIQPDPCPS